VRGGLLAPFALLLFPLFWLAVTALIGRLSGWSALVARYPDRDQIATLSLRRASGIMNQSRFGRCLRLDVCLGGLRISVPRIIGPFQPPFLVPWGEIAVEQFSVPILGTFPQLVFGNPRVGTLLLPSPWMERVVAASPIRANQP
jgi:hypothetical protein